MARFDRLMIKLRANPGEWVLAGKGLSEASVAELRATGVDVVTQQLTITRRGKPIFDVMARYPKSDREA